jgi:hypothetical protein
MAMRLEAQFMHMWDLILTDLHYASTLLDPFLMNVMEKQNNGTAKHALKRFMQKLSGPLGVDFNKVVNELTHYGGSHMQPYFMYSCGTFSSNLSKMGADHCQLSSYLEHCKVDQGDH